MVSDFACRNGLQSSVTPQNNKKECLVKFWAFGHSKSYGIIWDDAKSLSDIAASIFADVIVTFNLTATHFDRPSFEIKDVIFNNPATIVLWADGTKTVVKCQEDDIYSEEMGLALCIAKKALGNKGNFNNVFRKWLPVVQSNNTVSIEFENYTLDDAAIIVEKLAKNVRSIFLEVINMITIGQKVKINPFKDVTFRGCTELRGMIDGVVHFVHPTHRWFNVEYGGEEGKRLIAYKFDDIGKAVKLVKD